MSKLFRRLWGVGLACLVPALVALSAFSAPATIAQSTLTFAPVADAYVTSASPSTNYGTATTLRLEFSPHIRSYLRFSISGVNSLGIRKAILRLYVLSNSTAGITVLGVSSNNWTETGITYNNAPTMGASVAAISPLTSGTWVSLNVSAFVKSTGTYSLGLTSSSTTLVSLGSRESGASTAPQLVVTVDPVIAAAGDIACDPTNSSFNGGLGTSTDCRQKYTSDLLVNKGLSAVLDLGDTQYQCGTYSEFLQSYALSWGRVKAITHPSIGNHEYLTCGGTNLGAAGYFEYFGAAAGSPSEAYYSFSVGTWHIIALNSSCSEIGGCAAGSAQYDWLQSDLSSHANACTLAYWHIPLFSSGALLSSDTLPLWQLLYQYNAELILNGHDHIYERFAPQTPSGTADSVRGIREFIAGTGGDHHTSINVIAANSEIRNTMTYGVLMLALHLAGYNWQFVPESGQTFTDSGAGKCH